MDGKNTTTPIGRFSNASPASRDQPGSASQLDASAPGSQWVNLEDSGPPEATLEEVRELMSAARASLEDARNKSRLMAMRMGRLGEELEELRDVARDSLRQRLGDERRAEVVERMRSVEQLRDEVIERRAAMDMLGDQLEEQALLGQELEEAERRAREKLEQVDRLLSRAQCATPRENPVRDSAQTR